MAYPFPTVDASPESSPDAQAPNRPAAVPAVGVWNAEVGKWEVSPRDARGVRNGECLLYRDDGTLYSRSRFVEDKQDGPFFIYNRDGNVAREGQYVAGQIDGTVTAYASENPEGEPLRKCCVPPGAARLCERYRAGHFLVEVFYDREGRAILSDGRLCPPRPEGLPELAQFDESRGGWTLRSREVDRFWSEDGTPTEEIAHGREGARVVRRFDAEGQLQQEAGFTRRRQGRRAVLAAFRRVRAASLRRPAHPPGTRRVRQRPAGREVDVPRRRRTGVARRRSRGRVSRRRGRGLARARGCGR